MGALDHLYAKNLSGQGQTVAVVENSGTWAEIKNVINKKEGIISDETRERYKRHFLTPIGGPKLHPEQKGKWLYDHNPYHGSSVSSSILDLAPQAIVLPVSTYDCPQAGQYDLSDALNMLSRRHDVGIINVSGAGFECHLETTSDSITGKYLSKYIFPQRHISAMKAVAKAGRVVVVAAGNESEDVCGPEWQEKILSSNASFMSYLIENLDSETLKSVVFAGAFDPYTHRISSYSNRPGKKVVKAQDRFLCAPGKHQTSYSGTISDGTSNSAPYICAAIANLASKPGVTPKKAVEALMETAEARPNEKHIYGRGLIRADRALEWLESRGF